MGVAALRTRLRTMRGAYPAACTVAEVSFFNGLLGLPAPETNGDPGGAHGVGSRVPPGRWGSTAIDPAIFSISSRVRSDASVFESQ